jgi:hypothetical protein
MIYGAPTKRSPRDMSVGPALWLELAPLPPGGVPLEIDGALSATMPMWDALETECAAGCCGINSFSFWPQHLQASLAGLEPDSVTRALEDLRNTLDSSSSDTLLSSRLNSLFHRASFIDLVDYLLREYRRLIDEQSPEPQ